MPSIFTRIMNREQPAKIFHEDTECIVIADHRPKDKVHLLIIPKEEVRNFYEATPEMLSMLCAKAKLIAEKLGIADHFRLAINNGYCQEINHIHFHFMSNRGADRLRWLE